MPLDELFNEDGLSIMSCTFSDYEPQDLVSWLETEPDGLFSPKVVALNCLCALRANDVPYKNHGCELTARFCSPTNVASTLTPAHFAQYLSEPWYSIFAEWDDLVFHSESTNEEQTETELVV
ncbi:unnamed protein product, partial [Choristocarpus tenellus]